MAACSKLNQLKGRQFMQKILLWLSMCLLMSMPLLAQDNPKVEVFGGYQYQSLGGSLGSFLGSPYNGWDAAVTYNLSKHFGVTGDFSGNYHSGSGVWDGWHVHMYTYAGGPVYSFASGGKFKPFAHALFGGAHTTYSDSNPSNLTASTSNSGYTMMLGGGADYKLKKALGIRLAQVDWVYYHVSGTGYTSNVRISSGVVFHF
jgi:hypothetical protein